ncbi:hypothetical protein MHYP_G00358800 [Metynnis hypsauchen]
MSEEGWRLCCRQPLYHGWLPRPLYLPEGPGAPRKPRTEQDPSPPTRTRPTLLPLLPASLRPEMSRKDDTMPMPALSRRGLETAALPGVPWVLTASYLLDCTLSCC